MQQYRTKISPQLQEELKLQNPMAAPRLEKIVVNSGLGKPLVQHPKNLETFTEAFRKIVGQQPLVTKARKAISAFKIREGQIVGLAATLRGKRMYDFFDKLVNVTLPRGRDFRGLSRSGFDGHGNYSLGLREHIVFPEMAQEEVAATFGVEVTIVTSAKRDDAAYALLKKFGFPFSAEGGSASLGPSHGGASPSARRAGGKGR